MLFKALSAAVFGIDAYVVEVEVDVSAGNGIFLTVGLPDTAVKESKKRIKSAMKNCGLDYPFQNITVNLAPAGHSQRRICLRSSHGHRHSGD